MRHLDEGRLQEWLDRPRSGMEPADAARIERHLEACEECARRLAALEGLDARAEAILDSVEPTDTAVPDYREVVARSRRGGRDRPRIPLPVVLAWAASFVLALGVGWVANDLARSDRVALVREQGGPAAASDTGGPPRVAAADGPGARQDAPAPSERPGAGAPTGDVRTVAPGEEAEGRSSAARPGSTSEGPRPSAPAVAGAEDLAESEAAAPEAGEDEEVARTAQPAEPGRTRVVRGRVTDAEGRPLPSARVVAGGGEAGSVTDREGAFSLALPESVAPADSAVSITAQRIGYASATRRITRAAGDTVSADFRLRPQAVSLEALTVRGEEARDAAGAPPAWRPVSRAAAEEEVGFGVLAVPGLEVVGIEVGAADGAPGVRVRQTVEPGTVLTIVQRRVAGATPPSDPVEDGLTTVSERRGDLLLTATAPLPGDSVRALLRRARSDGAR